jgi:hypothetical protein
MLRRVPLVRTDVSEELSTSVIRVTRTSNQRTLRRNAYISSQDALVASYGYVPSSPILVTLMMEALSCTETSVLTRATRHNIPEDAILLGTHFRPLVTASYLHLIVDGFSEAVYESWCCS